MAPLTEFSLPEGERLNSGCNRFKTGADKEVKHETLNRLCSTHTGQQRKSRSGPVGYDRRHPWGWRFIAILLTLNFMGLWCNW